MSRYTITGVRGSRLPNLEAHGFQKKMKPLAALIDEQDKLRQRSSALGHERQELQERIKRLEHERTRQWGAAIRSGEEAPTDAGIETAKKRLEKVRREIGAVRHAGELADAELSQTVAECAEEYDAFVQAQGEKLLAEAQEIAEALSAKLAETEGLAALHGWLMSGAQSYTPPTPATISIDNLLHERRRDLGLLDVGVIG
jgi:DNA repair exonuclease SbcCD ATPase subunit